MKNTGWLFLTIAAGLFSALAPAFGVEQTGTLTQVEGRVKILSHPSKTLKGAGPGPHVLYEGTYYTVIVAKAGDKLEKGGLLTTSPGGKARVVYPNGDQFVMAPATSLQIDWDTKGAPLTSIDLRYGKLRGVVEPGGPRSHMKIRTRSAVMGVRGTDFFVADEGLTGGTEVAVLRGKVEVEPRIPSAKAVEVQSGYTVAVAPPQENAPPAPSTPAEAPPTSEPVRLARTPQVQLKAITEISRVKPAEAPAPAVAQEIRKLESKAAEAALKDIERETPALARQLRESSAQGAPIDATAINDGAVEQLLASAPETASQQSQGKLSLIEDMNLNQAKAESGAPAEERPLDDTWIGITLGGGPSMLRLQQNSPSAIGTGFFEAGDGGGSALGLAAEKSLSAAWSLRVDVLPQRERSGEFHFPMGPFAQNYFLKLNYLSVSARIKWDLAFTQRRTFGLSLSAGPGLDFFMENKTGLQNIAPVGINFQDFNKTILTATAGIGTFVTWGRFKFELGARYVSTLSNLYPESSSNRLKSEDLLLGLSVLRGL